MSYKTQTPTTFSVQNLAQICKQKLRNMAAWYCLYHTNKFLDVCDKSCKKQQHKNWANLSLGGSLSFQLARVLLEMIVGAVSYLSSNPPPGGDWDAQLHFLKALMLSILQLVVKKWQNKSRCSVLEKSGTVERSRGFSCKQKANKFEEKMKMTVFKSLTDTAFPVVSRLIFMLL